MVTVREPSPEPDIAATVLGTVRSRNAYEQTVERLLRLVKLGIIPYGERLPTERELAARLNVSRVTVREGIRSLQQAGYLEPRRGRFGGTFVVYKPGSHDYGRRPLDSQLVSSLDDVLAFRQVVETGAVELAASRQLTDHQRANLLRRLREATEAPLESYRQADARLHLAIAELSGSAMVTRAVAEARVAVNDLLNALPPLETPVVHSNEQHDNLVQALLAHDPGRARSLMLEHLDATAALLRGFLG
jgi:GntR family transcriptional regulator, transcriptional repressor for pyruvate dehydrogenase complex